MPFTTIGEVVKDFHVLGNPQMPTYLYAGPEPVLFDAGVSCLAAGVLRHLDSLHLGASPSHLFLTHAHYDHCGGVSALKKALPGLRVAAAAKGAEIVRRPGAQALITRLNDQAAMLAPFWGLDPADVVPFEPFEVDRILEDGEEIFLEGGRRVQVLATPGHTWDSQSYFLPDEGILICAESAGCCDRTGFTITEFLVDFEAYLNSVERLAALDAQVLCQGHLFVFTGAEVADFFQRSREAAAEFRSKVDAWLAQEGGNVSRVVDLVRGWEYDPRPQPKQPLPAYLLNVTSRVRHLARLAGYPEETP
ncbi:MAG: MBL fold metallo-hydrolase [Deltaproteobacteria bacterium]|nr:MBL fold metallo-hydrolase [Deltaproteobacteria bacterium]